MAKKLSKILWYGAEKDALGKPVIPPLSPSVEKHLEGLNEGEIYIHNDDEYPALYIRTNKDKIVAIGGAEALMKYFLRKDQPDTAREVITFEKGLNVGDFVTGASGASFFKDLTTGQTIMELDKLYVRMKAFFETLTIVEAQTISGKQIISPAGSVRCTNVEEYDEYYRCYFLNEQDGEKIENKFIVGDQVYSQMFNAKTGTSNKISNRYYWRLVTGVGENYIDLSKTDCDADSDAPMVGDVLNQRGHRYPENSERMNFIETSTVDGFSPSITLFHGVNSFSLAGKDYIDFGVDKTTNKAIMYVYGDMYVGDRNKTSYMRYTQEEGLVICGKLDVGTKLGDSYLKDLISASTPEGYQEFVEKVTQDIEGLQAQIDGTIDSYFFQYEPSLDNYPASEWDTESEKQAHLNDTFTNLVDGRSWRWSLDGTYKWVEITDTATTKALALAGEAQDTADGKRRVFVVTDEHPTPYPPYDKGDLWSRGSNYPLMICVVPKESGVYVDGDFDYADNNVKLKEEMQTLVTETKSELNNSIGQAKNEAVNNANKYTDEGKAALQESINALERAKANIEDVYTQTQADGKISAAEERALKAAEEEADSAITYYDTIVKAYADGVATEDELAMIAGAKAALDAAKKYAEEQAKAAKSEIENSYLFQALQDAQSTEIENGLVLTSLIQLRDTQSNIMSGINGLINANKGDKSIATWWGGDMLDLIDYYRWDGTQWVVKSGITAPSNIPSGLIRMDGTGYLAKGKFWWDNDGKIYADPSALFLSFDVNAKEGTLAATILNIESTIAKFSDMWEVKKDSNGNEYLFAKRSVVTQGGLTQYSDTSGLNIDGIYDAIPIDGSTIYWDNGVLKARGGGGGVADSVAWADITGKPTFSTVATSGSYNDLLNKPTLLSSFTNDAGFITSSGSITGSSKILKFQNLISSSTINIWNGGYNTLQIHEVSQGKNAPTNYAYGYLHNYSWNSMQWSNQLYFSVSDYESRLFTRGYRDDTDTWTPWNTVAFLSDIDSKLSGYLPLEGGTLTGDLGLAYNSSNNSSKGIRFQKDGSSHLYLYRNESDLYFDGGGAHYKVLRSDNYSSYALPLTGGTINIISDEGININRTNGTRAILSFKVDGGYKGGLGIDTDGVPIYRTYTGEIHTLFHTGNLTKLSQLTNDSGFITSSASITGNAATSTKLATARTIWGQSFDGSGNISGNFTSAYIHIQNNNEINSYVSALTDNIALHLQFRVPGNISLCAGGGKVGIGTTSPEYKLHVNGSLNATTIYQNGSALDSLLGAKLNSSSYTAADVLAKLKTVDGSGSGLDADTLDGVDLDSIFAVRGSVADISAVDKIGQYRVLEGATNFAAANGYLLNFKQGNLSLQFNANYAGKLYARSIWYGNEYNWNQLAYITDNVASATKLQTPRTIWGQSFDGTGNVSGNLSNVGNITTNSSNTDIYLQQSTDSRSWWTGIGVSSGDDKYVIYDATAKQHRLSIDTSGKVGIGTTSPSCMLDVNGAIKSTSEIWGNLFYFTSAGKEKGWFGSPNNAGSNDFVLSVNSGDFRINTSNTERMRITSSGNVGIGTTSPTYRLDVDGNLHVNSNIYGCLAVRDANGNWIVGKSDSDNGEVSLGSINKTQPVTLRNSAGSIYLNSSGDVGIGTTSPNHKLHVAGAIRATYLKAGSSSYNNGAIELYGDTPFIDFHYGNSTADFTNRLIEGLSGQLTCTGKFRIGLNYTTSTDYNFYVSGSAYISSNLLTGGGITMYSQRSLKNVIDEDGLSLIELSVIKPTRYTWKDKRDERLHIGGIADDIQQVLPEVVYRTPDGVLTMDYGNAAFAIASSLIQPVISHEERIARLERENRALKEEVKRLRA